MNIAYAGNRKVFKGMLLSLLSIIKHSSDALNVYIVTMDLKDINVDYAPITVKDCSILEAVVKNKNPESKVILLDATNIYLNTLAENKTNETKFSPYSLIKLYLDEVNSIPDRLIYLDPATLLLSDLKEIDNMNIEDFELAAVKDTSLGQIAKGPQNFNSGVLFLNMKLIKESGLFRRCRTLISSQTKVSSNPDQDALNKLAISVLFMESVFNEQRRVKKNSVLRNFVGNPKPWEVAKLHAQGMHDFDDIFVQYEQINNKFSLDESIMPKTTI